MVTEQLLRDQNIEPTEDVIADCLGQANTTYVRFLEEIEKIDIQVDWRYYNDGKSWLAKALYKWVTSRGTQKETTACWLSIWDGLFKVTIYIPTKHREDALSLPLSDEVKTMVAEAQQIGKLKFFPLIFDIDSEELFKDILALVEFRGKLK